MRPARRSWIGLCSNSFALLNCLFCSFSSCRYSLILRSRLFVIWSFCSIPNFFPFFVPNRSFPMLYTMMVTVFNVPITSSLCFLALWTQGSCWHLDRSRPTLLLHPPSAIFSLAFPFICWPSLAWRPSSSFKSSLLYWDDSGSERFLILWVVSWLWSSGVSPRSMRCFWNVTMPQWLIAWCITSPLMFLHTLPHVH